MSGLERQSWRTRNPAGPPTAEHPSRSTAFRRGFTGLVSNGRPRVPPGHPTRCWHSARQVLLLSLAGPAAAAAGMAFHALFGERIVLAMYEQRMPVALLNEIITGQSIHPVGYHLERADALVMRGALLLLASGPATGGWMWLSRGLPRPLEPAAGGRPAAVHRPSSAGSSSSRRRSSRSCRGWFWPLHTTALPWGLAVGAAGRRHPRRWRRSFCGPPGAGSGTWCSSSSGGPPSTTGWRSRRAAASTSCGAASPTPGTVSSPAPPSSSRVCGGC